MKSIDLNCDMGESYGAYTLGLDDEAMGYVTSANVACGWHAGDPAVMDDTVKLAKEHGVSVGAHSGYPDLQGFGRRKLECSEEEVTQYVIYQVGALQGFCRAHGVELKHVKPHGALYTTAIEDVRVARAIARGVAKVDSKLIYFALAGSKGEMMGRVAREEGLEVVYEAFPDRAYTPDGALASRKLAGAVISDPEEVAERALLMASEGKVIATDGTVIDLEAQTLCVHGDTPDAVALVRRIRQRLEGAGIAVRAATGVCP